MKNWMIVTGASGSMGSVAVRSLAAEGYPVVMACRDVEDGKKLYDTIKKENPSAVLELQKLDLVSRDSVREFVAAMSGRTIAGLFNNAGTMSRHYSCAEDGIERTLTVNFLNVAYLTKSLVGLFEKGARIDTMVSLSLKYVKYNPLWYKIGEKEFGQLSSYALSKRLLLYFAIGFAKRHPEFHVNVSDPFIVNSNMIHLDRWFDPLADIFFRPFIYSPEKGVQAALRAMHSNSSLIYYMGKKDKKIKAKHLNSPFVDEVWDKITELTA